MLRRVRGGTLALAFLTSAAHSQEVDKRFQIPLKSGTVTPVPIQRQPAVPATASSPPAAAAPRAATPATSPRPATAIPGASAETTSTTVNRLRVQFNALPSQAQIDRLRSNGIILNEYIGGNSYYATTTRAPAGVSAQDETIRSVEPILPREKIHPDVTTAAPASGSPQQSAVTVRTFRDTSPEALASHVQSLNGSIISTSKASSSATILIDNSRIEDLAKSNAVKTIEPAAPPKQRFNDGLRRNIGADALDGALAGLDGSGVKVGIWDGGIVAKTHGDFQGRLTIAHPNAATDDHATHVAGTLASDGTRSKHVNDENQLSETLVLSGHTPPSGMPAPASAAERTGEGTTPAAAGSEKQWRGIAPGAHVVSFFWNDPMDDHEVAISAHGVEVSQNSWGFTVSEALGTCRLYGEYTTEAETYDRIVTGLFGRKIPVVFAAGNERNDGDCGLPPAPPFESYGNITPPVTAKNVITVGAINSDDDQVTDFSSWGPTKDGRIKPDIVTAGCEKGGDRTITSTFSPNSYGGMCGTSMAAPAASGVIAILIQQHGKLNTGTQLLPSSFKAALIHSALDLETPGPDYKTGFGKIALKPAAELVRERKITESQIETTGQTRAGALTVPTGAIELRATLTWDDAPGSPASTVSLVNDLDLQLTAPSGQIHLPLSPDPQRPQIAARETADHVNVVEQVLVSNPEPGLWKIQVRGFAVPVPPQAFSLAVTFR